MFSGNYRMYRIGMIVVLAMSWGAVAARGNEADRIQPYSKNPYYWQYKGEPVLLLGGSWQDNLFNHPIGLERHLDLLKSVGGNYVRNTMSHRNKGNVFAYAQRDGKFDLDCWNDEYWQRFDSFLKLTHERDIIVQIEVFDPWDYFVNHQSLGGWSRHPFNPANNLTYTAEQSGLPTAVSYSPTSTPSKHPFWLAVPALQNNELVLRYQRAYVDKMLSISLKYPHVLYCIQNESGEELAFGDYWADHIHRRAREAGRTVFVADMRRTGNVRSDDQRYLMDNPKRFTFIDISQSSGNYDHFLFAREYIAENPRPINSTKLYNRQGDEESVARMFRIIFAGGASARFHRPHPLEGTGDHEKSTTWGLGLSPLAQVTIRSARSLTEEIGWPEVEPDLGFVDVRTGQSHVAYTRNADGQARLYINGKEATAAKLEGDLSNWDAQMRLALGDEFVGDRGWLGVYHGVAIYNRALNASEVADHYAAGVPKHRDGLQIQYRFDEGEGTVVRDVSGLEPALDLYMKDTAAVAWQEDGLRTRQSVLIATRRPAERLAAAVRAGNAFTLEAWITPAAAVQSGPARIVTLSRDHGNRNFTLGQEGGAYEMRLRTTATSVNGLPAVQVDVEPFIAALRSLNRDRAAIFVTRGGLLKVDMGQLREGLQAQWLDPSTGERQEAAPRPDGYFQPPSRKIWLLVLRS